MRRTKRGRECKRSNEARKLSSTREGNRERLNGVFESLETSKVERTNRRRIEFIENARIENRDDGYSKFYSLRE